MIYFSPEFSNQLHNVSHQLSDLKLTRQLASEITHHGAQLYDHLAKEAELKVSAQQYLE